MLSFAAPPEITLQTMKRAKIKNCKHTSSNLNIPNFRETKETLHALSDNVIDDEEFVLLFEHL